MFSLLINFYKFCKKKAERKITLALLGLDNAGKTTLLNAIQGEIEQETTPTFGFNTSTLQEGKYTIEVFDLGGGKTFRSVWSKYLAEVHGILYIVDAADAQRFDESKKALHDVLDNHYMREKPILVFANKQDLPTASTVDEVVKGLGLATCRNSHNVFPCTAKPPSGTAIDGRLRDGLRWLVSCVDREYRKLNPRVQLEAEEMRQEEARKKKERDERIRRQREERIRLQKEEEERAREVEKENDLHDGKGSMLMAPPPASQPELSLEATTRPALEQLSGSVTQLHPGVSLGLPHTIESPGKLPPTRRALEHPPSTSPLAPQVSAPVDKEDAAQPNFGLAAGTSGSQARPSMPAVVAPHLAAVRPSSAQSRSGADDVAGTLSAARPISAGRVSVGSGGAASACSTPRKQSPRDTDRGSEGGDGLSGRPPRLSQVASGGLNSINESGPKGSFSLVHQNKVVPVEVAADVPA